jgi:trimethylamine:corrinoid methyltransferase-like protein
LGSAASSASSVRLRRRSRVEDEREELRRALDRLRPLELLFHDEYIRVVPMFVNSMARYKILSDEAMDVLDRGWRRIVSELGVDSMLPEAVELFRQAGQTVEGDNLVKLDPEFVLEQVAKAPREFELQARNPERSRHIGGDHMVVASVYRPPFVREGAERAARIWPATLEAYEPPPIDEAARAQLQEFVACRRQELGD